MASLGERLRAERAKLNLTQRQVAGALGKNRATVSLWENDKELPGRNALVGLAALYGVSVDQFVAEMAAVKEGVRGAENMSLFEQRVTAGEPTAIQTKAIDVPVCVTATLLGGEGFVIGSQVTEHVRRPPGIATARDVFALWVCEDSMSPRYDPGDLIYVHPGRQPRPGDCVLIEIRQEGASESRRALIRRLVKRTADEIVVEQFKPAQVAAISVADVHAIMLILSTAELMGM